jgi:hypothetical protein
MPDAPCATLPKSSIEKKEINDASVRLELVNLDFSR